MTVTAGLNMAAAAMDTFLFADPAVSETITITRDSDGNANDVLDESSGTLEPYYTAPNVIYDGPALISPQSTRREPGIEGAAGSYPDSLLSRIPLTVNGVPTPVVKIGDTVKVTRSGRNAHLVDRTFTVDGVPDTGRQVTRRFTLHATARGPRR